VQAQITDGIPASEITGGELNGIPTAEQWVLWIRSKSEEMASRS
jgi:hypothetical protein